MNNARSLYRDPVAGKLSGVCAGIANYVGAEVWLIRILVISAALLGGSFLVLLVYIALSFMLEKQPASYSENLKSQQQHALKNKPWQQGQEPAQLLATLDKDLARMEKKLRNIEAYVTSDAFKVDRAFQQL